MNEWILRHQTMLPSSGKKENVQEDASEDKKIYPPNTLGASGRSVITQTGKDGIYCRIS